MTEMPHIVETGTLILAGVISLGLTCATVLLLLMIGSNWRIER